MEITLTTEDVCELLHVSRPTVRKFRQLEKNPLPHGRVGKRYVYDRDEILEWVRSNATVKT